MESKERIRVLLEEIEVLKKSKDVVVSYEVSEEVVDGGVELCVVGEVSIPVNMVYYPGEPLTFDMGILSLWEEMKELSYLISMESVLLRFKVVEQIKEGGGDEARRLFLIKAAQGFLEEYRRVVTDNRIASARARIADYQGRQRALLPLMSVFLKRAERVWTRRSFRALNSGKFWKVSEEALREYFRPPLKDCYLADVSEKWGLVLFLEYAFNRFRRGLERNGLTGRGYLCGNDKGDAWGRVVDLVPIDGYGNIVELDGTVEGAMSVVFGIPKGELVKCRRFGQLLFCSMELSEVGAVPLLRAVKTWKPYLGYKIKSPSLRQSGAYIESDDEIRVIWSLRGRSVLPPGRYRLYTPLLPLLIDE